MRQFMHRPRPDANRPARVGYHGAMDSENNEPRLVAIEEKIAYFEKYAADLNDAVVDLSKQLDAMRRELKRAESRFDEAVAKLDAPTDPADEKPPHY